MSTLKALLANLIVVLAGAVGLVIAPNVSDAIAGLMLALLAAMPIFYGQRPRKHRQERAGDVAQHKVR